MDVGPIFLSLEIFNSTRYNSRNFGDSPRFAQKAEGAKLGVFPCGRWVGLKIC